MVRVFASIFLVIIIDATNKAITTRSEERRVGIEC